MYDWPLHQLAEKNVFLQSDLAETIYMEQPRVFVAHGENNQVCQLNKSYMRDAISCQAWFGHFNIISMEFGLQQCRVDHTVFYQHSRSRDGRILLISLDCLCR